MVDHLIEMIFKDVSVNEIGSLLKSLTCGGSEVVDYNITCDVFEVKWSSEQSIEKIFKKNKEFGLFLNLNKLEWSDVFLPKCGISIYKYKHKINLEINFQLSELKRISNKKTAINLMKLAKYISVQHNIMEYYCGLEPAEEKETRLFTNQEMGPLSDI